MREKEETKWWLKQIICRIIVTWKTNNTLVLYNLKTRLAAQNYISEIVVKEFLIQNIENKQMIGLDGRYSLAQLVTRTPKIN